MFVRGLLIIIKVELCLMLRRNFEARYSWKGGVHLKRYITLFRDFPSSTQSVHKAIY